MGTLSPQFMFTSAGPALLPPNLESGHLGISVECSSGGATTRLPALPAASAITTTNAVAQSPSLAAAALHPEVRV